MQWRRHQISNGMSIDAFPCAWINSFIRNFFLSSFKGVLLPNSLSSFLDIMNPPISSHERFIRKHPFSFLLFISIHIFYNFVNNSMDRQSFQFLSFCFFLSPPKMKVFYNNNRLFYRFASNSQKHTIEKFCHILSANCSWKIHYFLSEFSK